MALTALIALTTLGLNLPLQNPAAAASVTDALKLERTYKADEKNVYALKVGGAPSGDINLTITQKVTKLLDNGNATVELAAEMGEHASEGSPAKFTSDFSKKGMPSELHVNGPEAMYAVFAVSSYLPADSVAPGKDFPVSWTSKDTTFTIMGTGTYVGLEDLAGKKVARVKYKLNVHPGSDTDATIDSKALFDAETGKLVSGEGKIVIGSEGDMNYTIKLKD